VTTAAGAGRRMGRGASGGEALGGGGLDVRGMGGGRAGPELAPEEPEPDELVVGRELWGPDDDLSPGDFDTTAPGGRLGGREPAGGRVGGRKPDPGLESEPRSACGGAGGDSPTPL
jgi:hypothetical protein